jgi:pilus assembly protein CpaC
LKREKISILKILKLQFLSNIVWFVILSLSGSLIFSSMAFSQEQVERGSADGSDIKEKEVDVVLGIDKQYELDFVPHQRIEIGRSDVLDYVLIPNKKKIIFKGLKPGVVSVLIWNTVGDLGARLKVQVTSTSQSQVVSELKEFLGEIEGLEIGIKGKHVYVGGEIVVPGDIGKVNTILERYADVIQLYELSPQTQRVIARKMQDEMKKFNLKDVTVRVVNKVFWLEGVVTSASERDLAWDIAAGYAPDEIAALSQTASRTRSVDRAKIVNFITVNPAKEKPQPPPKMIKVVAQFVELTKDYTRVFGFKWTPTLAPGGGSIAFGTTSDSGVTTRSNGVFTGTIGNLFPRLASAKSAGYARIIQSGMVIMKDKTRATLSKQNVTPFTLGSGEFQQGSTVRTGFTLNVDASIVGQEKVELGVGIDVTEGQGTSTSSNRVSSRILVKTLESAVVGGIATNQGQTKYDKDPPSGSDTVDPNTGFPLFSFLRSKSHLLSKGQFVIFITPEIIDSPSKATYEIKKKFRQRRR